MQEVTVLHIICVYEIQWIRIYTDIICVDCNLRKCRPCYWHLLHIHNLCVRTYVYRTENPLMSNNYQNRIVSSFLYCRILIVKVIWLDRFGKSISCVCYAKLRQTLKPSCFDMIPFSMYEIVNENVFLRTFDRV